MRSIGSWMTLGVLVLAGCAGPMVNYQYDRTADFSRLKTYRWTLNAISPNKGFDTYVRNTVDAQLAAKGYQKKEGNGANFLVGAASKVENQRRTYALDMGPRYDYDYSYRSHNREWDHEWCYVTIPHQVGTLALYVIDPPTKKVIWEGYAEDIIDDAVTIDQRRQKASKFISDVLSKFPPQ